MKVAMSLRFNLIYQFFKRQPNFDFYHIFSFSGFITHSKRLYCRYFLKITMKKKTLLHYNRSFYGIAEYNESLNNILDHIWQISLI